MVWTSDHAPRSRRLTTHAPGPVPLAARSPSGRDGGSASLAGGDAPASPPPTLPLRSALLAAAAALERNVRRARGEAGLLDAEARALAALRGRPGATVSELARLCALQQPTMTKTLDRLVGRGWVERSPEPRDRRVIRLRLLDGGESLAARLAAAEEEAEARLAQGLPQGGWGELRRLLDALTRAAEEGRRHRRRSILRDGPPG